MFCAQIRERAHVIRFNGFGVHRVQRCQHAIKLSASRARREILFHLICERQHADAVPAQCGNVRKHQHRVDGVIQFCQTLTRWIVGVVDGRTHQAPRVEQRHDGLTFFGFKFARDRFCAACGCFPINLAKFVVELILAQAFKFRAAAEHAHLAQADFLQLPFARLQFVFANVQQIGIHLDGRARGETRLLPYQTQHTRPTQIRIAKNIIAATRRLHMINQCRGNARHKFHIGIFFCLGRGIEQHAVRAKFGRVFITRNRAHSARAAIFDMDDNAIACAERKARIVCARDKKIIFVGCQRAVCQNHGNDHKQIRDGNVNE